MADHQGTLTFEKSNDSYKITRCETHFRRHHNVYYPDANPICDKITLAIRVSEDNIMKIQEWYIDQTLKEGTITNNIVVVNKNNEPVEVKRTVKFKNALCFSMKEVYDIGDNISNHEMEIEIFPSQATIDDCTNFTLQ